MSDDTISRQAAIDALGEEPEVWTGNDEYAQGLNNQWHYDVNALKAVPSTQPDPQWIPCSERLPDEDYWTWNNFQYSADVLMTVYNAGDEETIIDYGHTTDGKWYSDTTDCYVPSEWKVIAWMSLPEPYKEGTG